MASLIIDIQAKAMSNSGTVTELLRMTKVAAIKLDLGAELAWIENELSGYEGNADELPGYRRMGGELKAMNPVRGWIPVVFSAADAKFQELFSQVNIWTSIPELEQMLGGPEQRNQMMLYTPPPLVQEQIRKGGSSDFDVRIHVSRARLHSVIDAVRNLVLEWSLKMEQAGVLGDKLLFSPQEIRDAAPVAQTIHIQNVGTLGNVSGNASVVNIQGSDQKIDNASLISLLAEIRQCLPAAPPELTQALEPVVVELERESNKAETDQSKVRELLTSARSIAENAAGGIVASGIVGLIGQLL